MVVVTAEAGAIDTVYTVAEVTPTMVVPEVIPVPDRTVPRAYRPLN